MGGASFVLLCPKIYPVKVEQKGSKYWQRPTRRPTQNSQTQSDEELGPQSQGATVSRDRWSAYEKEKKKSDRESYLKVYSYIIVCETCKNESAYIYSECLKRVTVSNHTPWWLNVQPYLCSGANISEISRIMRRSSALPQYATAAPKI